MRFTTILRATLAFTLLLCAGAHAQGFPDRAVRMIVPFPPGGGLDITARLVSQRLSEKWKVPVVVDNKAGADGQIGLSLLAKSAPDGYTVGVISPDFATSKALYTKLPFDPAKDFTPVGMTLSTPYILGVSTTVPAASVKELVELSHRTPGKLNYSASSTTSLLIGEMFRSAAGIDAQPVPFKGSASSVLATAAGEVTYTLNVWAVMKPMVDAKRIRVIAVGSRERLFTLPHVPTLREAGVNTDDVVMEAYMGVIAPAGVPPEIVARLNAGLKEVLAMPDVQQQVKAIGAFSAYSTSEELGRFLNGEFSRYERAVTKYGIKPVN